MDKPEQLAKQRENQRGNHKWTNQSNWQLSEKTKGAMKNGQTRATGNIMRKPKGQSKMDKPEQLATQGTQDDEKQNSINTTQYALNKTMRE